MTNEESDSENRDVLWSHLSTLLAGLVAIVLFLAMRNANGDNENNEKMMTKSNKKEKSKNNNDNVDDTKGVPDSTPTNTTTTASITIGHKSENVSSSSSDRFILLLGVDDGLFKRCFGQDDKWPCKIRVLAEDCDASALTSTLKAPGLLAVVFQDDEGSHWNLLKAYYAEGGFLVYFGIYGEYAAPSRLGQQFGFKWNFSAYTKHEYTLTPQARAVLPSELHNQQYTKSNLVSAPPEDRWMVPKPVPFDEFKEDYCDEDDSPEYIQKKFSELSEGQGQQSPLVVHKDTSNGGRIAYLGFVNGDGNIPAIVRGLLTS